jgi:hypothetical protein
LLSFFLSFIFSDEATAAEEGRMGAEAAAAVMEEDEVEDEVAAAGDGR